MCGCATVNGIMLQHIDWREDALVIHMPRDIIINTLANRIYKGRKRARREFQEDEARRELQEDESADEDRA